MVFLGENRLTSKPPSLLILNAHRFPYSSMGASLLLHVLVILTLALAPLPRKTNPTTEFEKEKVTFYKLSQKFPDISPLPIKSQPFPPKHGASGKLSQPPESPSETEIAINRAERGPAQLHVELPEASQLAALPKLE